MMEPKTGRNETGRSDERSTSQKRQPFDTSDLGRLQYPDDNDPPYRPFWVEDSRG
jgi:hypothetical protein